ncbi:hypothetical protein [Streptomyces sviceus]|uniref:hypothetical protein n=1 Tax=Streptomyces sviceus TaxID=285530 RepID=UPI0033288B56
MANTTTDADSLTRGEVARALLWSVVVISAVGNMAASVGGAACQPHRPQPVISYG